MRKIIKKVLFNWLYKRPIRKYTNTLIGKDEGVNGYLYDLLCRDEAIMVGSRSALVGYYDLDIQINRELQDQLKQYAQ